MRLAVTGAAGFVGGAVVSAARGRGWQVTALTRREWDIGSGPLPDPPALDAVVHAAAVVGDVAMRTARGAGATAVWRANLHGTRHVAETFPGVRLVHVSTSSVYDPFIPTVLAVEDTAPVDRYLTTYEASKAAAERLLAGRPDTVVLRPHAVYGPGDRTLLPRVLGAVRGRTLVLPGDGAASHTLTGIGNLVDAVLRACSPDVQPGTYNVGDAAPVVLGHVLRDLLAERGVAVRVRYVPVDVAWALASVGEELAGLLRRPTPRLTRYAVHQIGVERTLDLTAARERLGFDPAPTTVRGAADW